MTLDSNNNRETYPPIKISDIKPSNTSLANKTPDLNDLDKLFGPLPIGEFTVSREELHVLGATLDGEAISPVITYFSEPDQTFIDTLEFDPVKVEQRIRSADATASELVSSLLYEIVTLRSPNAAPLLRQIPPGTTEPVMDKITGLLNATQRVDIRKNPLPAHLPGWVDLAKSRSMTSMGAGLQAYGLYSAYTGMIDALKKGQLGEALVNAGGGVTEIGSLGLEYALTRTGEKMIRQGALTFEHFGKTTMGKWLCRSAGLIASALTLPFDIYTAIKSFSDAAHAQGKEAQDLYVAGGLSVFSAGLSLMLATASLMGFQAAGPIGIAAAAILIVGARVYSAVRVVDDIDDYIELSVNERWRAGWFAFTGQDQDKSLMDRFTTARTYSDYAKALQTRSNGWLDHELKDSIEAVVNGRFEVKLLPARVYKYQWNDAIGESAFSTVDTPLIEETDDHYDARNGLPSSDTNIISRPGDASKGVLWKLGGGNDSVLGVRDKPNHFNYGAGQKRLNGGDKDDTFVFQSASAALASAPDKVSYLQGGPGTDLLWLQGKHLGRDHGPDAPRFVGYDIDLVKHQLGLRSADAGVEPVLHSTLDGFEKVETLAGAANRVRGGAGNNLITANGDDRVDAGPGDDQVFVRGSHAVVDGGGGADTYHLDRMSLRVSISEDAGEPSKVYLGVALEAIQSWRIHDNDLLIETLRSDDPQTPRRELILEAVYQTLDGKRSLRNDKWMFITEDGYHLQPDWPAETADLNDQHLSVIVVVAGIGKTSPFLLHDTPQTALANQHSSYFVSRDSHYTTLRAGKQEKDNRSTLYVDFDSTEIDELRSVYTVDVAERGAYRVVSYQQIHFILTFIGGGKLLSLHGGVSEKPGNKTERVAGILASPWQITHPFTLVMRDGVSYHLDLPRNNYREDAQKPGYNVVRSREPLRERAGKYIFVQPAEVTRRLKRTAQRIDFRAIAHSATYSLEGRSAYYEMFPASNMTLRLSTAMADASISGSSTWRIYTTALTEHIGREQLSIADNLLIIGSIHVHLPDSRDPSLPLETVDVVVSAGHRYRINPLFEVIGLCAVNALACATLPRVIELIHTHKKRNELESDEVLIENIRLPDSPAGKIFYNAVTERWSLASKPSRSINPEHLIIGEVPKPQTT